MREPADQYPVLTVTGPRQSGKTTLCRALFPDYGYANLEPLDQREFAREDPRCLLAEHPDNGRAEPKLVFQRSCRTRHFTVVFGEVESSMVHGDDVVRSDHRFVRKGLSVDQFLFPTIPRRSSRRRPANAGRGPWPFTEQPFRVFAFSNQFQGITKKYTR